MTKDAAVPNRESGALPLRLGQQVLGRLGRAGTAAAGAAYSHES